MGEVLFPEQVCICARYDKGLRRQPILGCPRFKMGNHCTALGHCRRDPRAAPSSFVPRLRILSARTLPSSAMSGQTRHVFRPQNAPQIPSNFGNICPGPPFQCGISSALFPNHSLRVGGAKLRGAHANIPYSLSRTLSPSRPLCSASGAPASAIRCLSVAFNPPSVARAFKSCSKSAPCVDICLKKPANTPAT